MSLDLKLREELSIGGSSNFGGFLGVGANGENWKKLLKYKKKLFYNTLNPEIMKYFSLPIIFIVKGPLNEKLLNKRGKRRRFGCNQHPLFKSKEKEEE